MNWKVRDLKNEGDMPKQRVLDTEFMLFLTNQKSTKLAGVIWALSVKPELRLGGRLIKTLEEWISYKRMLLLLRNLSPA